MHEFDVFFFPDGSVRFFVMLFALKWLKTLKD